MYGSKVSCATARRAEVKPDPTNAATAERILHADRETGPIAKPDHRHASADARPTSTAQGYELLAHALPPVTVESKIGRPGASFWISVTH